MAKRRKGSKKSRARHRRSAFGSGIHRPRLTFQGAHRFHMREHSPYRGKVRAINRRHNPMLAEYLLGNPRHRGGKRRRHNPPFTMATLTNPMPLLVDAGSGVVGVAAPILVGNFLTSFIAPNFPMVSQPGIVGSAIRAAIRLGAAVGLDMVVGRVPMLDQNAFRVGEAIGIGGSFLMDLLGRPLLIGPGDQALSLQYFVGGMSPTTQAVTAGQGAYFRRQMTGQGAYFRRNLTGTGDVTGQGALVPVPRVRGVGAMSPKTVDLFSAF